MLNLTKSLNTKQIDLLNIGLILVSCGVAYIIPFKLFLFSYAVLGPLHYLTEIGWLHKRNYFTKRKNDYLILGGLCLCYFITFMIFYFSRIPELTDFYVKLFGNNFQAKALKFGQWATHFVFISLLTALAAIIFKEIIIRFVVIIVTAILAYLLTNLPIYYILMGVFLPTLIHVYVFTGVFMLQGALKSKSKTGIIAFITFICCGILVFLTDFGLSNYNIAESIQQTYIDSTFNTVNKYIFWLTGGGIPLDQHIFGTKFGLMVQRFIAYAYTYHYLNWFSKTSVIKWHEVKKSWLISSVIIWIIAISLYVWDYKIGLLSLMFISMLHVILEFPLNYHSFTYIGKTLFGSSSKG